MNSHESEHQPLDRVRQNMSMRSRPTLSVDCMLQRQNFCASLVHECIPDTLSANDNMRINVISV